MHILDDLYSFCQPLRDTFWSFLSLGSGEKKFPVKRELVEKAEALATSSQKISYSERRQWHVSSHPHERGRQTLSTRVSQAAAQTASRVTFHKVSLFTTREPCSRSPPRSHRHTPPSVWSTLPRHNSSVLPATDVRHLGSKELTKGDR